MIGHWHVLCVYIEIVLYKGVIMKVFISDLHMSSPLFKKGKEVKELFNSPNVEEIYILGDLLDTWEEDPFFTANRYSDLIELINKKVTLIIKGNHDPSIEDMQKIFPDVLITTKHEMELFGKKVLLVHGDEVDRFDLWARLWFPIHYCCERLGINFKAFVRNTFAKYKARKNNLKSNDLILKIEKDIVAKYKSECDILITGHSHLSKVVRSSEIDFANCGSLMDKPSYLIADKNTLVIKRI